MIFVDSNIPMYLSGTPGPKKEEARALLERCFSDQERLVTSAEVFQELLHRYSAVGRREAIQPAFESLLGLVDEIFPVDAKDVGRAKDILLGTRQLSARDALHLATMESHGVTKILSFDAGFDGYPGVSRIS